MKITAVLVLACVAGAASAQTSVYYLADGDNSTNQAYQGTNQVWSMAQQSGGEYPIAVNADIRTYGTNPTDIGNQYDLGGNFLGGTYTNNSNHTFFDSTTDGQSHFLVSWSTGDVIRTDTSYQSHATLFNQGGGGSALSLTYDPTNNSLWVADFTGGQVTNYDMAGNALSSFNTGISNQAALALDHADGSLWLIHWTLQTASQFDKAGNLMSSFTDANMTTNPLGGEFALPAPGSLALLGLGGIVAARRRR